MLSITVNMDYYILAENQSKFISIKIALDKSYEKISPKILTLLSIVY